MEMRQFKLVWALLLFVVLLGGCASPKLSVDQRAAIRKVTIGEVVMPEKPVVFGDKAGGAFLLGGPIGLAIANSGSDLPTEYAKLLERGHIDVAALLREDLKTQLVRQGFEVVPAGQPSDATIVPKVLQYGLTGDVFASPPVRVPQLWLRVDLKRTGSSDTLWWHWASVHVTKGIFAQMEPHPIREYFDDTSMLEQQVKKASRLVTEAALSEM
jgi:hypothetical protein